MQMVDDDEVSDGERAYRVAAAKQVAEVRKRSSVGPQQEADFVPLRAVLDGFEDTTTMGEDHRETRGLGPQRGGHAPL